MATRDADGLVREGDGGLHLANVILLDGNVAAFDCIEFNPSLRWIDILDDVPFLVMNVAAHGRDDFAFASSMHGSIGPATMRACPRCASRWSTAHWRGPRSRACAARRTKRTRGGI